MSVKQKRSPLWVYFTETPAKNEASCSLCNESIKTSGNTTNMSKHLKLKHAAEYDVALKGGDESSAKKPPLRKQSSLDSSFTLQRTRSIDTALARMVALDLQPLSVVETKGFRDFVHELNASYGAKGDDIGAIIVVDVLMARLDPTREASISSAICPAGYDAVVCPSGAGAVFAGDEVVTATINRLAAFAR